MTTKEKTSVLNTMRGNSLYLSTMEGSDKARYAREVEALDTAMELMEKSENNTTLIRRGPNDDTYKCNSCRGKIPFVSRKEIDYKFCPYCGKTLIIYPEN